MALPTAGIDPHQDNFTVGIVDQHGVQLETETFANSAVGFVDAIDLLTTHRVGQVGIEGSASWGAHVAIAVVAAGFDAREVPAQRSAAQRRSRRLDKTDAVDAISAARALQAEPTLGPVQTLEVYDPLVAKIEAVLEHRRALVSARTLMLAHVGDQIAKLPTEIRDQLTTTARSSRAGSADSTRLILISTPHQRARIGSHGYWTSSIRTRLHVARSGALSASSMNSSTNTAPPCVKNLVSVLSRQQHWCVRLETPFGSVANQSSRSGAAPEQSRSPRAKAVASPSNTDWTSEATGASTASSTSHR